MTFSEGEVILNVLGFKEQYIGRRVDDVKIAQSELAFQIGGNI